MKEPRRQALLQAYAFSVVFTAAAERELKGAPPDARIDAAKQLRAALRILRDAE